MYLLKKKDIPNKTSARIRSLTAQHGCSWERVQVRVWSRPGQPHRDAGVFKLYAPV